MNISAAFSKINRIDIFSILYPLSLSYCFIGLLKNGLFFLNENIVNFEILRFFLAATASLCLTMIGNQIKLNKDIIIVGVTGSGKSTLINRFLGKKSNNKKITLIDGCKVYDNFRSGNDVIFPATTRTCGFLIIDSISLIKETAYWNELMEIIRYRKSNRRRTVFVVQGMLEFEERNLGMFMRSLMSSAYVLDMKKHSSLSKALFRFKAEYVSPIWKGILLQNLLSMYLLFVSCLFFPPLFEKTIKLLQSLILRIDKSTIDVIEVSVLVLQITFVVLSIIFSFWIYSKYLHEKHNGGKPSRGWLWIKLSLWCAVVVVLL